MEVELELVGAILYKPSLYYEIGDTIKTEYFSDETSMQLVSCFKDITDKGLEVSFDELIKYKYELKDLILLSECGVGKNRNSIKAMMSVVIDNYKKRKLIELSKNINSIDIDGSSVDEVIDSSIDELELVKNTNTKNNLKTIKKLNQSYLSEIEDIFQGGDDSRLYPTNYKTINYHINGLRKSELIILAGRPAMGKTTLAMNLAEHYSVKNNVLFFSLEMGNNELIDRLVSRNGNIDLNDIRSNLNQDKMNNIIETSKRLENSKLIIDDNAGNTIDDITFICRRLKKQNKLDIVFIDNINIIKTNKRYNNSVDKMTDLSGRLKVLAKDLDIPVVVLSQLSRKVEDRDDKKPLMSDLRESGSIEQDADIVMLLYREEYYLEKTQYSNDTKENARLIRLEDMKNKAELIIGKCRRAKTGTCKLMFNGARSNFYETY